MDKVNRSEIAKRDEAFKTESEDEAESAGTAVSTSDKLTE
jgi:hypothetical protein